jgi:hypothetical protein
MLSGKAVYGIPGVMGSLGSAEVQFLAECL